MIPNTLTVAGVDPSGGAGVFADLKAFSALGAFGTGVITALTAQNTRAVTGVQPIAPEFVRQQIDTLFDDVAIAAAKTGMLATAPIARAVAEALSPRLGRDGFDHLVVDPVMIAKSGDALLDPSATRMLIDAIVPLATMITPNLPEAGVLLGRRPPDSVAEMRPAAERLRRLMSDNGQRWVLLKGGHLPGDPIDLLHDGDRMIELPAPRISTRNTHGTGCTLSAAITAACCGCGNMGGRRDVVAAVREAKRYLTEALRHADELRVGSGHGPVHHFHALWSRDRR